MEKKGILLIQETTKEHENQIKEIAPDYTLVRKEGETFSDGFSAEDIEVIYGWGPEGKEVLENDKNQVKWIQSSSAGVDFLNLSKLAKQKTVVTNVSGIHSIAIAESVFAMILYKTRGILHSVQKER